MRALYTYCPGLETQSFDHLPESSLLADRPPLPDSPLAALERWPTGPVEDEEKPEREG